MGVGGRETDRAPACMARESNMAIASLLANSQLPLEQQHVIELAFDYTLRKLSLVDRNDPVCEVVARKVIEVGTSGFTNAVAIGMVPVRGSNSDQR